MSNRETTEQRLQSYLRERAESELVDADATWVRIAERVERGSMRRPPLMRRAVLAPAAAVSIVTVLALVFSSMMGSDTPAPEPATREFIATMRHMVVSDYEPAATPAVLAARVDAVVRGTIVGVEPGQSYAPTPESDAVIATSVIEVAVSQVLVGNRSLVFSGSVYIEVPHPAYVGTGTSGEGEGPVVPFDHAAFAATVPIGVEGAFFLEDRTAEPYWDTIINEGAGRPAGAKITQAFVQGFLIESPDGHLVSVLEPLELMPPAWQGLGSLSDVIAMIQLPGRDG
jgi:hypothetical protein